MRARINAGSHSFRADSLFHYENLWVISKVRPNKIVDLTSCQQNWLLFNQSIIFVDKPPKYFMITIFTIKIAILSAGLINRKWSV